MAVHSSLLESSAQSKIPTFWSGLLQSHLLARHWAPFVPNIEADFVALIGSALICFIFVGRDLWFWLTIKKHKA
jgi:hypothetical protein